MLAENLMDSHNPVQQFHVPEQLNIQHKEADGRNSEETLELKTGELNDIQLIFIWLSCHGEALFLNVLLIHLLQNLYQILRSLMEIMMCNLKKNQYVLYLLSFSFQLKYLSNVLIFFDCNIAI